MKSKNQKIRFSLILVITIFLFAGLHAFGGLPAGGPGDCNPNGGDESGEFGSGGEDNEGDETNPVFKFFIDVLASCDPNEIIGPPGYDNVLRWVSINDNLGYTINFENDPAFATSPAHAIRVDFPVPQQLNVATLRLSDFGFGSFNFTVPPNSVTYQNRLDVKDSLGVFVDITAGIDVVKRSVFWIFQSIDPATGLPPTDPLLGFLPVSDTSNVNKGGSFRQKGEGFVTFNVKPVSNAKTGDTISAKASIVFDLEGALATNVHTNTIDAAGPTSKVSALPASTGNTVLTIKWTGNDDPGGSGVRDYSLYVSENGNPFSVFQSGITGLAANFTGSPGNTYSFYTLATDNTGNPEAIKTKGDQSITIRPAGEQSVFYHDSDNDGFGNIADTIHAIRAPSGYVADSSDCDDTKANIHPGAAELCDGLDNNCNGQTDEGVQLVFYHDADKDGFGNAADTLHACSAPLGYVADKTDCNDGNSSIHALVKYYLDADHDGYGSPETAMLCSSDPPIGYSANNADPNDNNPAVHPGPSVKITSPLNGTIYTSPATIKLSADATVQGSTIKSVDFYHGDTLIFSEKRLPYSEQWFNVPVGNYTIIAKANDNNGNTTISTPVTVSVVPAIAQQSKSNTADVGGGKNGAAEIVELNVHPNPANNTVNISIAGLSGGSRPKIFLLSVSGVIIKTIRPNTPNKSVHEDISSLRPGTYIIKMISRNKVLYKTFEKL